MLCMVAMNNGRAKAINKGAGKAIDSDLLKAKFDQLIADYNECVEVEDSFRFGDEVWGCNYDRITLDNIRHEATKYLNSFILAGFDISKIVNILDCKVVWEKYDFFKACKVKSTILKKKVLDYLESQYWCDGADKIIDNFAKYYKRGVGPTTIIHWMGGICCWELNETVYEGLLEEGVDEETANQLIGKWVKYAR